MSCSGVEAMPQELDPYPKAVGFIHRSYHASEKRQQDYHKDSGAGGGNDNAMCAT